MMQPLRAIDGGKAPNPLDEIRNRCAQNAAEPIRSPEYWRQRYAELDAGNARIREAEQHRPPAARARNRNAMREDEI